MPPPPPLPPSRRTLPTGPQSYSNSITQSQISAHTYVPPLIVLSGIPLPPPPRPPQMSYTNRSNYNPSSPPRPPPPPRPPILTFPPSPFNN